VFAQPLSHACHDLCQESTGHPAREAFLLLLDPWGGYDRRTERTERPGRTRNLHSTLQKPVGLTGANHREARYRHLCAHGSAIIFALERSYGP
jgi:hypothetical protein